MNDDVTETEQSLRIPYRKPVYIVRYNKSWYNWRREISYDDAKLNPLSKWVPERECCEWSAAASWLVFINARVSQCPIHYFPSHSYKQHGNVIEILIGESLIYTEVGYYSIRLR